MRISHHDSSNSAFPKCTFPLYKASLDVRSDVYLYRSLIRRWFLPLHLKTRRIASVTENSRSRKIMHTWFGVGH